MRMGHPHGMRNVIDYDKNPFIVIWEVTRACQLKVRPLPCRCTAYSRPTGIIT